MIEAVLLITSYFLGAIPFGYILTKSTTGKNILDFGSGNIGSTNVKRIAGKKTALYTQFLDIAKGLLPVGLFLYAYHFHQIDINYSFVYLLAIVTILGHSFSPFLRFKGGKGVNTTLGASFLLGPITVLLSVSIYYLVKWRSKYVSLGSLAIAIALPTIEFIYPNSLTALKSTDYFTVTPNFYYFLICSALIIFRHRSNIKRLILKEEHKV